MKKTVNLQDGENLMTKRMEGTQGTKFPKHTASKESALVLLEGQCTVTFPDRAHTLQPGETLIIPANEVHQVVGEPDFKAIHIMPKDIRFRFNV